ncbi:substrate-binding periplasmic protein [Roseibium sp.]|uniref:substrate-binding periplasmic protein n=1 Tax=Roseibium sp. TaxID=1936156 RepID=UPI003B52AB53
MDLKSKIWGNVFDRQVWRFCFCIYTFWMIIGIGLPAAAADDLRIITTVEPPTNYLDEQGRLTGTSTDIVRALQKIAGIETEIEVMPWSRGYLLAKSRPNIALFTGGRTPERVALGFEFIGPLVTRRHGIYMLSEKSRDFDSLDSIADHKLRIAGLRGSWRPALLAKNGIFIEETDSLEAGLRMLQAKRVDGWISSDLELSQILRESGVRRSDLRETFLISEASSFLLLSKGTNQEQVAVLKDAFETLQKTDLLMQLAQKWSGILEVPFSFSSDRGLFLTSGYDDGNRFGG